MDERRIERALRDGPPNEPAYQPRVVRQLATDARTDPPHDVAFGGAVPAGDIALARRRRGGPLRVMATMAAATVVLAAALSFRLGAGPGVPPSPTSADLLGRLRAHGSVVIAVTSGPPQTIASGGAYIGFDVDVAGAIAERLSLRHELMTAPTADILGASGSWHLALPSRALPPDASALTASRPYYAWPAWLVVASSSPVSDASDLGGAPICAVAGSAGAEWVAGRVGPGVRVSVEAPSSTLFEQPSDEACMAAIESGDAAAAVTAALLDDELGARGVRPVTSVPVLTEQRSVVIRGAGMEVASLRSAVDDAIGDLQSSGGLAELSRRAFGGSDLTEGTP